MNILKKWGLNDSIQSNYDINELGRITEQHHNIYKFICERGFFSATVSGKFDFEAENEADYPAVGDWVLIKEDGGSFVINKVLPRTSSFGRKAAGTGNVLQIVAANVDKVFICMAMNEDFNISRLERYLSIAWDSGAVPIIVLTKVDLCDELYKKLAEVENVAFGVDVVTCSNQGENGYDGILPFIKEGKTVAFIGSSGVGKSTMVNYLMQEDKLETKEIRVDGKGKHTTTFRQLMLLPSGGIVMDTPGMREIGVVSADLGKTFADIEELSLQCKFSDCTHGSEPGCAVRAAIESGQLSRQRLDSYLKLQSEMDYNQMNFRQIEEQKINKMFGGKNELKKFMREVKKKNR